MAETSHDIRRELEVTRERVGDTIAALERKVNPKRVLDEYPLVVLGVAFGVGVIASRTGAGGNAVRAIRSRVRDVGHVPTRTYESSRGSLGGSLGDIAERLLQSVVGTATAAGTAKLGEVLDLVATRYGTPRSAGRNAGTSPRSFTPRPVDEGYAATHPTFAAERR